MLLGVGGTLIMEAAGDVGAGDLCCCCSGLLLLLLFNAGLGTRPAPEAAKSGSVLSSSNGNDTLLAALTILLSLLLLKTPFPLALA